ncbi:hypothetical protein BDM02DRAFT_3186837 [Thelephora ganbajun]|uniref:Uncharacterized protein n=1 Tax=Thelephora ganbajun TaxID=370292 RepID=A0ACB6ZGQ4_THEGA|nr:hypothetical protein BDM02DRAFT_3186837 [Thelephora ganbajun]
MHEEVLCRRRGPGVHSREQRPCHPQFEASNLRCRLSSRAPSPSARPTHGKRILSPLVLFNPPPVFSVLKVPVPRVRSRIESNGSIKELVDKFSRNTATPQVSNQGQSRISFAGFDSFDEVRHGFEFGPSRLAFYPPVSFSREYNKHGSIFSIASVPSFGPVINNGGPDPFS